MSSQNPRPPRPRRRIAGERRPARPADDQVTLVPGSPEPPAADESASPATSEPGGPAGGAAAPPQEVPAAEATETAETAETAETPEPAETPTDGGTSTGPSWWVVGALGGLALVLVVVVAVLGLAVWNVRDVRAADRVDETSRTAPAAAERAAAAILSYDYRTLDADEKAAERDMSPAYAKRYADTFARLVKPNATKLHAKVEAEVKGSGVMQAEEDRATVLLFVDQTTTSTANDGQPQFALNRVKMSMVKQDGAWLVDGISSY
jgi:Mce-associated membrane protein